MAPRPPTNLPRQGPRPLPMHLGLAAWTWMSSRAALPLWKNGSLAWKTSALREAADALQKELASAPADGFDGALDEEIRRRLGLMLDGVAAYRDHPYRRDLPDPPVLWREGTTRLLDYGGSGPTVLVVPSLINRGYVLDLSDSCSLVRTMAGCGLRPLLIDWGAPGPAERGFDLTAYIAGRLGAALDVAAGTAGAPVAVMGYCMGGDLALALACLHPERVERLALLATPWDFHADDPRQGPALAAGVAPFWPLIDALGAMPVDLLQVLFAALDPYLAVKKFTAFGALDPASARARLFVALEDWLNDGIPLAAPVARECVEGWYGGNGPARGLWRVDGMVVDPRALAMPVLGLVPANDRIVPPASASALLDAIPGADRLEPPLGHIGMVVSAGAPDKVWAPLIDWLGGAAA